MQTGRSVISISGEMEEGFKEILTEDALQFLTILHEQFEDRRQQLLHKRTLIQEELNKGGLPQFLRETSHIRAGDWTIAPLPEDLKDRRVEITGPVDRKMVINALNSGANVFMADFEDANSPTWHNNIHGQLNLRDAVRRTISFTNDKGKQYELHDETAVLVVRPRGWHLDEKHIEVEGKPMSGSLVDFGLYFYHNAKELIARGSGPYFYLPKMENHYEARLWNEVFQAAQDYLNLPNGTIKATVLIETILASFEMDEILFELKDHSAGLNCGRWDYIFSYIKKLREHEHILLPDRAEVTMEVPFMRAYSQLAIQTCHKRNAPAIGGMAAQIPVKNDEQKNAAAFQKVRADKEREVQDGHDGTWVAHPGMVQTAKEVFDEHMKQPNQIHRKREDLHITAEDLLQVPKGKITEEGLRTNLYVGIQYIAAWLNGRGAVPIRNLMEDAATAEISRTQVWQWIRHKQGNLEDGRSINEELVHLFIAEELDRMRSEVLDERFEEGKFVEAAELFSSLVMQDEFEEFLTVPAYQYV
ncbi:malate synthase [Pontibacillus halophilus JSM 076056 = DSM 19796]|uniref:Malate synthase n=1 Tax=Pontibacillus halophilus JSM 076056 = DSM 19796 TaxID=1385510 RepID=A0A0A5GNW3_9BACI|nr:malate synthase A [Pontibacillus halophilus]KGX92860.1 malate synthase [Pontibacillus halophilus JSM 076056 = DSM 19796]